MNRLLSFTLLSGLLAIAAFCFADSTTREDSDVKPATVTIHFLLGVPDGTNDPVYITGNLPQWGPWDPGLAVMAAEGNKRIYQVEVPAGTLLEYKFTQGSWSRELLDKDGHVSSNFQLVAAKDESVSHIAHGFGAESSGNADPDGLLKGLTGDRWRAMHPDFYRIFLFPEGRSKALVISMDDCPPQDERFAAMLKAHHLKGSFHVNSGSLGTEGHLTKEQALAVYQGHEVSCHTLTHPWLTTLSVADAKREILGDQEALAALVGHPVRGLAYPFGAVDTKTLKILTDAGFVYARTTGKDDDFSLPENPLLWPGSGHQSEAVPLGKRFFAAPADEMALLVIWGHSWELDRQPAGEPNSWESMEQFFAMTDGRTDLWSSTFTEAAEYVDALSHATISPDGLEIQNKSAQAIWIRTMSGAAMKLEAGATERRDR